MNTSERQAKIEFRKYARRHHGHDPPVAGRHCTHVRQMSPDGYPPYAKLDQDAAEMGFSLDGALLQAYSRCTVVGPSGKVYVVNLLISDEMRRKT